mgnify:CR=1 FL=1
MQLSGLVLLANPFCLPFLLLYEYSVFLLQDLLLLFVEIIFYRSKRLLGGRLPLPLMDGKLD